MLAITRLLCGIIIWGSVSLCEAQPLNYLGGAIVPNARVTLVNWNSDVPVPVQTQMAAFYPEILNSDYWSILSQYSMADGKTVQRGSYRGAATLTGTLCSAGSGDCNLSDTDILQAIGAKIDAAAPGFSVETDADGNVNTVLMVHFPPQVTIVIGTSRSCVEFGGTFQNYETKTGAIVPIGIIPDCRDGMDETAESSFWLAEIATDPHYFSDEAWLDNMGAGVAELCQGELPADVVVNNHTYSVALLWSNSTSHCVSTNRIFANGFEVTSN